MRGLSVALRWPLGVVLTAWSYMWRTTPMWRVECAGSWPDDRPPPIARELDATGIQRPEDGAGALFRRRYRGRITGAQMRAEALMRDLQSDPNRVAPGTLAHFVKHRGEEGTMRVGDEFVVRMPGPWDGPIRVVETGPRSFRVATLDGHIEAGQIEWRAADEDEALIFEIESWARGGDRLASLLHDRIPMAKEVQLHMWTRVVERVAGYTQGRLVHGIDITTRRCDP
jgi:hypothetical protein